MTAARFMADCMAMAAERGAEGLGRRAVLAAGGAAGAIALARLGGGTAQAAGTEVTIVNFGGDAVNAWGKAWAEPWAAESGNKATVIGGEPTVGAIKAMVESGKVVWDVTDGDLYYLPILAKQGLIRPYDYGKVDKAKVRPEFVAEYGCAAYLYSTVNAYDSAKTNGKVPRGYADYLNFADFPGKRAMYKWLIGSLEAVLIGDGADPASIYPLDVDRAFKLIEKHKDQILLWGGGAASQQLFRDGEVVMGNLWSTRASVLHRETKGRLTWVWDDGIVAPGTLQVLKGNPSGDAVFDFIASTQDPKRQLTLLDLLGNGPANPAAGALLTDEQKMIDCGYEPNYARQIKIGTDWYAANYDQVQNDFLDLMAS